MKMEDHPVPNETPSATLTHPADSAFEHLLYEETDGVAWITLNRPEVRNALSMRLSDELIFALGHAGDRRRDHAGLGRYDAHVAPDRPAPHEGDQSPGGTAFRAAGRRLEPLEPGRPG